MVGVLISIWSVAHGRWSVVGGWWFCTTPIKCMGLLRVVSTFWSVAVLYNATSKHK